MAEAVKTKQTELLLQAVWKNVKAASNSILDLMPRVKDEQLKSDLTVQLSAYEAFASRAAKLLAEEGAKPEDVGVLTKLSAKWATVMDTVRDSSCAHIAEMMMEGSTAGVSDMLGQIREAENTQASESALRLARDLCRFEEKNVEDMKNYLR